jgi:chromosome segregation ATPase
LAHLENAHIEVFSFQYLGMSFLSLSTQVGGNMNKHQRVKAVFLSTAVSAAALFGSAANAEQKIDQILAVSQSKTKAAQQSQKRIDKLAEESSDLLTNYKLVNKDIEGLKVYNAQLEKQIENQQKKLVELEESIGNITVLQRQIPPLAVRMLDALEQFVELDVPTQLEVRRESIAQVRDNLDRADFTIAEKFRQVLELYATEGEAGRKIETYTSSLEVDGQEREVDILAVGRVALMYQTKDTKLSGAWDQSRRAWVPLDSGEYRLAIRQGIKIADKRASQNVMQLPILAPEAAQ